MDIDAILEGRHAAALAAGDFEAWRILGEHVAWKESPAAPAGLILALLREQPSVVEWIGRFERGAESAGYDRKMALPWLRDGLDAEGVPPHAAIEGDLYDAAFGPRPWEVKSAQRAEESLVIARLMVEACPDPDANRARALLYVARFASATGALDEAAAASEAAAVLSAALGDAPGQARARRHRAEPLILAGKVEEAVALLEPDLDGTNMVRPFRSFPVLPSMVADRANALRYLAACVTSERFAFGPDWVFALGAVSVHAPPRDAAWLRFQRELTRLFVLAGGDRPLAAAEVVRQARNAGLPAIEERVVRLLTAVARSAQHE